MTDCLCKHDAIGFGLIVNWSRPLHAATFHYTMSLLNIILGQGVISAVWVHTFSPDLFWSDMVSACHCRHHSGVCNIYDPLHYTTKLQKTLTHMLQTSAWQLSATASLNLLVTVTATRLHMYILYAAMLLCEWRGSWSSPTTTNRSDHRAITVAHPQLVL